MAEKFRTLEPWHGCRYISKAMLAILEEMPWEKTFNGEYMAQQLLLRNMTLEPKLASRNLAEMVKNSRVPFLQQVATGTGPHYSLFMFVRPMAVVVPPSPRGGEPSLFGREGVQLTIHERVAGVEANLKEVLAAQGRAGDSASKSMIACTRNAEAIERVEAMLKRMLGKLGETV